MKAGKNRTENNQQSSKIPGVLERVCMAAASLRLKSVPLWDDIQKFGSWLESQAAPVAERMNETHVHIYINENREVESVRLGFEQIEHNLNDLSVLWSFIHAAGLREIVFDVRLDRKQVEDVMKYIYCHRKNIRKRTDSGVDGKPPLQLFAKEGVHVACTDICITDRRCDVKYSYCLLGYSEIVRWFEKRYEDFRDHRAIFHAAPKYAFAIGTVATLTPIVYSIMNRDWLLLGATVIELAVIVGLVYFFFSVVGSVEYDNEEYSYNLSKAYRQLERYSSRMDADVKKAKTVQRRMLPDIDSFNGQGKVRFAARFEPQIEVGGDYYDVSQCRSDLEKVVLLFSDVSGHGMGAALITAIIKTKFHSWLESGESGGLTELIAGINHSLCTLTPEESFSALFTGIYDTRDRSLVYANNGHHPRPWVVPFDKTKGVYSLDQADNLILGVSEDIEINTRKVMLEKNDCLVITSDGLVESIDIRGREFGVGRLEDLLNSLRVDSPDDLIEKVWQQVAIFSKPGVQIDDKTVLAMQVCH